VRLYYATSGVVLHRAVTTKHPQWRNNTCRPSCTSKYRAFPVSEHCPGASSNSCYDQLEVMAVIDNFEVPNSAQELHLPTGPNAAVFLLFLSSIDPLTKQPWCSDVRACLPPLNKIFSEASSPAICYAYVGSRAECVEVFLWCKWVA
jgi:hypothetical protein